jgi:hypothetical protein
MKTYETPFALSPDQSSRLLACEDLEISIILGDDAFHNLRISLQHAKLLLAEGKYERIYYINLPFSGKRFAENYKAAQISDDDRLVIFHVASGSLADTVREIRQMITSIGEKGRSAIIINSWEMSSRSYRHREDLIFTIFGMHMQSEATFFVYSVAESKHIIMRRSSRAGFGRLVMIADGLVDLATGKYTIAKKEEKAKQTKKKGSDEKEEKLYLADAIHYPEGEERDDFMRRHEEQQERRRAEEAAKKAGNTSDEDDGVGVNLDDRKINELAIEVLVDENQEEEGEYRQAA